MTGLADAVPAEILGTHRFPDGSELERVAPRDEDEFRAALGWARAERRRVLTLGGGSRTPDARGADLVLSTEGWRGVVAYEPGDGTLTARSGTRMDELARVVAEGGHHLTPAIPRPERSTLGGVLGAGASGFDRLRYGPARHNVLGMRVLLADGRIARSGGSLVKNVTGYDLHRLYTGARGALALVLEASLRLYPEPHERMVLRSRLLSLDMAMMAAHSVLAEPVRPEAVRVEDGLLEVFLAGRREVLEWESERIGRRVRARRVLTGSEAAERFASARDEEAADGPDVPALTLACLPSRLSPVLETCHTASVARKRKLRVLSHPGIATAHIAFDARPGVDSSVEHLRALRADLELALSGHAVEWHDWPVSGGGRADTRAAFGPRGELARRLARALDPGGVFAGGPAGLDGVGGD